MGMVADELKLLYGLEVTQNILFYNYSLSYLSPILYYILHRNRAFA